MLRKKSERGFQRVLKVCLLKVHGRDAKCLLDPLAVPIGISTNLARKLSIAILSTKKTITVANSTVEGCPGVEKNILITFGLLKAKIHSLVVHGVSFAELLGTQKCRN